MAGTATLSRPPMAVLAALVLAALHQGPAAPAPDTLPAATGHAGHRAPPVVHAPLAGRAPVVDGRLDDEAWQRAEPVTEFRQVAPRDGDPATERTEVRVTFDGEALYVAARLHDAGAGAIAARLGRRDSETASDRFAVLLDSYHDHRTTFRFGVNAAGVKLDGVAANDDDLADLSPDPVWEVATRVDSAGWTAELRIPFSQLRFSGDPRQTWGINFERWVQRKAELVRWSWAPASEQGFASHFGHLTGLRDVPAPRRLEVMPYVLAQGDYDSAGDPGNPFDPGRRHGGSAGLDLRYGLTSDMTLAATINPDFGQVEADPAEVNLGVFESYFQERRPFFVEGANLYAFGAGGGGFIFGAPQLFYSRRVGRAPSRFVGAPDGGYADAPAVTTILGAAKLSGQSRGWSVGLLEAVTAREEARLQHADGARARDVVEPLTSYAVASLRRDLRAGRSGIGLMGTAVNRQGGDEGLRFLRSSAYVGGVDAYHRFGGNRYSLSGTASVSRVAGDSLAILLAQRASARYYQRPDQDYVRVRSGAEALTGYALSFSGGKVAGSWLWGTDAYAYSPGFEINDAGFQQQVDRVFHGVRLTRRWLRPGPVFRTAQAGLNFSQSWNFGGTRVSRGVFPSVSGQLLNFWSFYLNGSYSLAAMNDKITRGGPLLRTTNQWNATWGVSTDARRPLVVSLDGNAQETEAGSRNRSVGAELAVRPTSALTLSLTPGWSRSRSVVGYVTDRADATAERSHGRRYVFADLDQEQWDAQVRADWALTPTLSFQLYAQPFVSVADYERYKLFERPRTSAFTYLGVDGGSTIAHDAAARRYTADPDGAGPAPAITFGDPDFRFRSLRTNLVLRWEYRPGAIAYVAWAHGRSTQLADARFDAADELDALLGDEQRNRLLVKVTYWVSR